MIDLGRSLRQITGSLSVRYSLTFLVTTIMVAALVCWVIAATVVGDFRWAMFGAGGALAIVSVGLVGYAVLRRPDLLRSEDHQMFGSYADWIKDLDIDDQAKIDATERPLTILLDTPRLPKPNAATGPNDEEQD